MTTTPPPAIANTADLLQALRTDPDFREQARALLLTPELLALPETVARLAEKLDRFITTPDLNDPTVFNPSTLAPSNTLWQTPSPTTIDSPPSTSWSNSVAAPKPKTDCFKFAESATAYRVKPSTVCLGGLCKATGSPSRSGQTDSDFRR